MTTQVPVPNQQVAQWKDLILQAAMQVGIDPNLLAALVTQESGGNQYAQSSAGAQGLTQLMPGTAAGLGVTNPFDPWQSLVGGATYLKQQLLTFNMNLNDAIAAYNAGPGAVQQYGGVPPYQETLNYVTSVEALYNQWQNSGVFGPPRGNLVTGSTGTGFDISGFFGGIGNSFGGIGNTFGSFFGSVGNDVGQAGNAINSAGNSFSNAWNIGPGDITGLFGLNWNSIKSWFGRAGVIILLAVLGIVLIAVLLLRETKE